MPRISRFVASEIRKFGKGLLSCALVAALAELLMWSQPAAVPLLGLSGQIASGDSLGKTSGNLRVTDHAVRRTKQHGRLAIDVSLNYPALDCAGIDADIQRWVMGIVGAFEENLAAALPGGDEDQTKEEPQSVALHGSYTVTRPSPAAVSLTFELWTYTGGAHGNLDIITLNYSLLTGQRLELVDLFNDPDEALRLMSAWSFQVLSRRLPFSRAWTLQMLKDGTIPDAQNFSSLTLTAEGIVIQFQPYQVAPWAAGAQAVEMPFEKLATAGPLAVIWGK
ncbi:MAG: DUF3298 and DUF4163 domain-containing protein [Desulfovibrio sp.]|jgi:hypothetical protein|nr:DUF3298 and DUF4163 domain-containing protein [Desulfovibrio sp.]